MSAEEFTGGLFMLVVMLALFGVVPCLCWLDEHVIPPLRRAWRTVRWEVGRMVRLCRFHVAVWLYNAALIVGGEER